MKTLNEAIQSAKKKIMHLEDNLRDHAWTYPADPNHPVILETENLLSFWKRSLASLLKVEKEFF